MGVIHKLKDEVIQFIVQKKKESPSLGCRTLAELASAQFQIKISKSSVNDVLKNHALSGSVGRPVSNGGKKGKFAIPQERKKQLFKDIQPPHEERKASADDKKEPTPETAAVVQEGSFLRADPVGKEAGSDDALRLQIQQQREAMNRKKSAIFRHTGYVFFLAAQWDMGLPKMMAQLIQKHIGEQPCDHLDSLCEAAVFLKFIGIESDDQIDGRESQIPWPLFNGVTKEDIKSFWGRLQNQKMPKNFDVIFLSEIQQMAAEAYFFKFHLNSGAGFLMDARFNSVCLPTTTQRFSWPLNKALTILSRQVISNNEPAIIKRAPGLERFDEIFYEFLSAYGQSKERFITGIEVLDEQMNQVADFKTIPRGQRKFMVGIGPYVREFHEITKTVKWGGMTPFYEPWLDRFVYYVETKTTFFDEKLDQSIRVISLWDHHKKGPVWAILTNEESTAEEVVRAYLMRWPNIMAEDVFIDLSGKVQSEQKIINDTAEDNNTHKIRILADFLDCFGEINAQTRSFYLKHFFNGRDPNNNISYLYSICYETTGVFILSKEVLKIEINLPSDPKFGNELRHASSIFNESHIIDPHGRRVILGFSK